MISVLMQPPLLLDELQSQHPPCMRSLFSWLPGRVYRDGEGRSAAPFQGNTLLKTLKGHRAPLRGIVVLPNAGHVASASSDGRLLLWDYCQGIVLRKFQHAEELTCLACRYELSLLLQHLPI